MRFHEVEPFLFVIAADNQWGIGRERGFTGWNATDDAVAIAERVSYLRHATFLRDGVDGIALAAD
jgi:hypothetical protein